MKDHIVGRPTNRDPPSMEGDSSSCVGWVREAAVGAHPPQREEFSLFSGGWRREEVLRDCSSSPSSSFVKF